MARSPRSVARSCQKISQMTGRRQIKEQSGQQFSQQLKQLKFGNFVLSPLSSRLVAVLYNSRRVARSLRFRAS